jgi:hypothetical protein
MCASVIPTSCGFTEDCLLAVPPEHLFGQTTGGSFLCALRIAPFRWIGFRILARLYSGFTALAGRGVRCAWAGGPRYSHSLFLWRVPRPSCAWAGIFHGPPCLHRRKDSRARRDAPVGQNLPLRSWRFNRKTSSSNGRVAWRLAWRGARLCRPSCLGRSLDQRFLLGWRLCR